MTVNEESASATYNTPALAQRLMTAFKGWFGEANTVSTKPIMGAEDFGLFGRTEDKIPICIFWLGTVQPERFKEHERSGEALPALHSSQFLPVVEPTLKTGITAMAAAVLELLGR